MFFLRTITALTLLITLTLSSVMPVQAAQPREDSLGQLGTDVAEGLLDEVVFDNLERLAGPACSLYGLGNDLVNFLYDGQWPLYAPLLEISVLFRNQPWRELIWGLNDRREALLEEQTLLKKRRCVVAFGLPQAWYEGDAQTKARGQEMQRLDRQIIEVQQKIDYFALQQKIVLLDDPKFNDTLRFDPGSRTFPALDTDKIFYWIYSAPSMNWEQFLRDGKQFVLRTYEDLAVVVENFPDLCSAVINIPHEIGLYFIYAFASENGVYVDDSGKSYKNFQEFVQQNSAEITREYINTYCAASQTRTVPQPSATSAEQQYEQLRASLENLLTTVGRSLSGIQAEITLLERKQQEQGVLQGDEAQKLQELIQENGRRQAMIEYYTLVLSKVGSPGSQSLQNLSESLSQFAEAILGVTRDEEGKLKSRLSFSERFEKSKARQLQKICGQIEEMYRKAGRSTADLPVIGSADGKVYCRAALDCADVDLTNFAGGSEGRRKLWECSGFMFNSSELGYTQQEQQQYTEVGDDIGSLLEQRSYNDLLALRDFHFVSLRERYATTYGTMDSSTAQLERLLQDVKTDLCGNPNSSNQGEICGEGVYDRDRPSPKNHMSVMRRVYQDFWRFMDQQEGSCPAPERPEV